MTRELYSPIRSCRLCHGQRLAEVLDLGWLALTGVFPRSRDERVPTGPLRLLKCSGCGLVQLAHDYNLPTLYGDNYGYRSGLNATMVRHLHDKVAQIERRVDLKPGDLVVDIGSNDGTLLAGYSVPGLRLLGIDPTAEKFRRYYTEDVEIVPEFFSAAAVKARIGQKARVVTSIACFYDLKRPAEFAKEVLDILAYDGIWVLEQSYLPAMVRANAYDTICHEHLEYYTLKQIAYVARIFGLAIIDVDLNAVNGGSFSVTLKRQGQTLEGVNAIVACETADGYDTARPFEGLHEFMVSHRRKLRGLLEDLKRQGKIVLGYGASTKGNVLLQWCGIDETLLPCIAEVNEEKFGCFTPGTKIPIVSESEARAMKPDYFLVLPWHFRAGIIKREAEFLKGGGKLIFPLPEIEIAAHGGSCRG